MDGFIKAGAAASLYEADEHEWLHRQVAALRAGRLSDLDAANLAEFLEDMARRDRRELRSRLAVLLQHMLKFGAQPERAGWSSHQTVLTQQNELRDMLAGSPSLSQYLPELLPVAFEQARKLAAKETELPMSRFPAANPWSLDEVLSWSPPEDDSDEAP